MQHLRTLGPTGRTTRRKPLRMRFAAVALFIVTVAAFNLAGPPPKKGKDDAPPVKPSSSVTTRSVLVSYDVNVSDRKGGLVTGLKKEHFKLTENGVEQELSVFEPNDAPVSVVLLVEYSRSTYSILEDVRAMASFLVQSLRPDDHVALVTFGSFPQIEQDFTLDHNLAEYKIARLQFTTFPGVDLFRGLDFVLDRMAEVEGKRAVVLLATGLTASPAGLDRFTRRAQLAGTPIFAVSMGRHQVNAQDPNLSESAHAMIFQADYRLRRVAEMTNGSVYYPPTITAFPGAVKDILLRLRHRYLVAYAPPDPEDVKRKRKVTLEAFYDVDRDGEPDKLKVAVPREYTLEGARRD